MLISYAQNGEDILLYRCFKDIKSGFYIDVGANHPVEESVTKYFYDQGWQGVNIEPEPLSFQLLSQERPLDLNINKCVSCVEKELEFYQIKNTGLSSLFKSNATKANEQGFTSNIIKVKGEKLTNILNSLNLASRQIEFLKIDTEGNEEDVIKSLDFKLYQPKVILVETVSPYLHENKSKIIDDLLITKDYKKVYFDGLNSYFIRLNQYEKLKVHFDTPVNIFDGFIKYKEFNLIENNNFLVNKIKNLEASLLLTSQIDNSV
jgi:FkbM family methyltransferase